MKLLVIMIFYNAVVPTVLLWNVNQYLAVGVMVMGVYISIDTYKIIKKIKEKLEKSPIMKMLLG